ncbi:hypothetical protein K503DRAFT_28651 [Rhizopogon vinicolor AM-OR11-026]|uniref:Uncharacterized protein n=1 Tax=Rhizopogon vinicolor AM-OR11-026 TaxID=1314800 RepID=A0A1B7N5E2_9AGAM|nr:hypothetical protein K503DRAFT_28651 [Rhizopogon vinicolor AM-OR11-026]
MKESSSKRKVTAKLDYNSGHVSPRFNSPSRPASPTKQSSLSPSGFRPTAKITSNATVRKLSSSASLKAFAKAHESPSSTPRPGSPLKQVRGPPSPSIVTNPVKARVTARPASKSAATSPISSPALESRQRSSTIVSSKLRLPSQEDRPRSGIAALHHAQSTSALRKNSPPLSQTPPSPELPIVRVDQGRAIPSAPIKIKSKISGLAKSNSSEIEPSPSLSSPWVTTRPIQIRPPMPSASSLNASPSPPNSTTMSSFYPITTAAPAANPHRYASPRRAPSPIRHAYQTPTPAEGPSKVIRQVLKAKVDPALIPLPPHSPPISAISLSSKSSVSRSSFSLDRSPKSNASTSTVNSHAKQRSDTEFSPGDHDGTASPTTNGRRSSQGRDSDVDSESSEHKARATAKSNRKIADLEITNKSLLAINASLETTKNRQAKEIRDLRRKLRESRLILPPRAFRAVESLDHEEEEGDDDDSEEGDDGAGDETYARVKDILERLVESGKKALERTSDDFRQSLPTKVLNADEVRTWRDSGQDFDTTLDGNREDEVTVPLSPLRVAVPDIGDDISEDESQGLTLEPQTPPPAHLPPITITPSSESS